MSNRSKSRGYIALLLVLMAVGFAGMWWLIPGSVDQAPVVIVERADPHEQEDTPTLAEQRSDPTLEERSGTGPETGPAPSSPESAESAEKVETGGSEARSTIVDLRIYVEFEDGKPYVGILLLDTQEIPQRLQITANQPLVVPGVDVAREIGIAVFHNRVGFDAWAESYKFAAKRLQENPVARIVIPVASEPNCGILVDLARFPEDAYIELYIRDESGGTWGSDNMTKGGGTFTSQVLEVGEKFRVVIGGDYAWQSPLFEMTASETRRVVPEPLATASVSLTISGVDGNAPDRAYMSVDSTQYADFRAPYSAGRSYAGNATPDESGFMEMKGLAPGAHTLVIEALGCEVKRIPIVLSAGETKKMGTFSLSKAKGSIEIKLEGVRDGVKYIVKVLEPGGTVYLPKAEMTTPTHLIEGLPVRRYTIAVFDAKTRRGKSQMVRLTAEQPRAVIEIDVSELD